VYAGDFAVAVTVDSSTRAGVDWLAAHLPERQAPASATVLPGDDPEIVFVASGSDGVSLGVALEVMHAWESHEVRIQSLMQVLTPGLLDALAPGDVAAARVEPVPEVGSLLIRR
jgi:hypothetical protein